MSLDVAFRKQIALSPREAMSHFEIVDPGAWRVGREGTLCDFGQDWAGPFKFRLDGISYEAVGLKNRLSSSQRLFLEDVGCPFEGGMQISRGVWHGIIAVVLIGAIGGIVWFLRYAYEQPAVRSVDLDVGSFDHMPPRSEVSHVTDRCAEVSPKAEKSEMLGVASAGRDDETSRLKERARAAFQAGKWSEAIPLVDQLTEETVDADLMYYIGIAYKEGFGVEHDFVQALYWFKKSADGGHAGSQYEMGLANERGNGIPKNEHESVRWYRIAADRGNAPANLSLGILYDEGRGVAQDASMAAKFYQKGSELGNAHAGYLLGQLYEKGRGVPLSVTKAAECYRSAASADHALAGYLLGKMYEEGRGVPRDEGEALYWYEKAGKLGNSAALSAWQRLRGTDKRWIHPEK